MSIKSDLAKYTPRKEQSDVIKFLNKNKSNKFFLLNLPTGTGKSHLSIMMSDWYRKNIQKSAKVDIITGTKLLQDQYSDTYESINDLKGKENYQCIEYECSCAQGSEFSKLNKTRCKSCPHSSARDNYISGGISLTNFYLYILYALYNPKLIESRDPKLLIVDECHLFDDVMSDFITIKITDRIIKKYSFSNAKEIKKRLKSVSSIREYVNFLDYFLKEVSDTMGGMERAMLAVDRNVLADKRDLKISSVLGAKNKDVKLMNLITDLKQLQTKMVVFLKEFKENPDNWVLESQWNEKEKKKEYSLEPIWAYDYLDKYIFSHYDKVILMSGTILDKPLFSSLNGLEQDKTVYYSIDSPFKASKRPIYYMPIGKMSYTKKQETFKRYIPYIQKVLKKYKGKKGIIHTNSFELANWIKDNIKDKRLLFHDSSNKDEILELHMKSDEPTVIVSPSVSTGVSFDNDRARFQIIAKIPYPSLASQKNKLRQKQSSEWYSYRTVAGLIQMYGRIVRNGGDWGDTIIIDESFSDVMRFSSKFLPNWFQKAIKRVNVKKQQIV